MAFVSLLYKLKKNRGLQQWRDKSLVTAYHAVASSPLPMDTAKEQEEQLAARPASPLPGLLTTAQPVHPPVCPVQLWPAHSRRRRSSGSDTDGSCEKLIY